MPGFFKEIEDLPILPALIRRFMMDYLEFIFNFLDLYRPGSKLIKATLEETDNTVIIDLCSGSGGPIKKIIKRLNSNMHVTVVLTDKYPNSYLANSLGSGLLQNKNAAKIAYDKRSIDARNVPSDLKGLRTMFSALHHFSKKELHDVFADAINKRQSLAFFDSGDKNFLMVLLIIIFHPLAFIFFTPFIRPFRFSRILFTYIIPVIPIFTIWDGFVSVLHLHKKCSLKEVLSTDKLFESYTWQITILRNAFGLKITSITGKPIPE